MTLIETRYLFITILKLLKNKITKVQKNRNPTKNNKNQSLVTTNLKSNKSNQSLIFCVQAFFVFLSPPSLICRLDVLCFWCKMNHAYKNASLRMKTRTKNEARAMQSARQHCRLGQRRDSLLNILQLGSCWSLTVQFICIVLALFKYVFIYA